MRKEHLEIARALYKPTPKVEALVLNLCDLFDEPLQNGVVIKELIFEKNHIKIGDLCVRMVQRVNTHCGVEIHWYPNYKISTKSDPFCSAFVLKPKEMDKIHQKVRNALESMRGE